MDRRQQRLGIYLVDHGRKGKGGGERERESERAQAGSRRQIHLLQQKVGWGWEMAGLVFLKGQGSTQETDQANRS